LLGYLCLKLKRRKVPPTSSELISAVSHPLRRRILFAYVEGAVECASAGELAAAMDQRVGQVAYHLKTLAKGEILRPVQSGVGQGATEAHYGWALGVEAEWLRVVLDVWAESDRSP
jgi:DNA-binding transcriptional ArsR family regulator